MTNYPITYCTNSIKEQSEKAKQILANAKASTNVNEREKAIEYIKNFNEWHNKVVHLAKEYEEKIRQLKWPKAREDNLRGSFLNQEAFATGTGFTFNEKGYVMTAAHTLEDLQTWAGFSVHFDIRAANGKTEQRKNVDGSTNGIEYRGPGLENHLKAPYQIHR